MRKLSLFLALFLSMMGIGQVWAQTVTETFENVSVKDADTWGRGDTFSNGWVCVNSSGSVASLNLGPDGDSYSYYINYSKNNTENGSFSLGGKNSSSNSNYLVVPVLMTGNITFYMCGTASNSSTYGYVKIYKATDNGNGTFTIGTTALATYGKGGGSAWEQKTIDLGSEETMIAINMYRAAMDDFTYTPYTETYKKPHTLDAVGITSNSATINWTAGSSDNSETAWDFEYKASADVNWTEVHNLAVTTTTYSLSGLTAQTDYDVRVRAIYGGESSGWKTISFTTMKEATVVNGSYTDDFELGNGWEFVNGSAKNQWVIGSAAHAGGSGQALYISNDNGTTHTYTNNSACTVYATKYFSLEAGDYTFSYDWICNGEANYDYMRVYLAPGDISLEAKTYATTPTTTGWYALDGGNLQSSNAWQNKIVNVDGITSGYYTLVVMWRNDSSGGSDAPAAIDNFSFINTSAITPVSVTTGTSGYTTFASVNALDLANLPAGLTAYYVTSAGVNTSSVTLEEVSEAVEANTALILKGDASTSYSIPVATSGNALSGNLLVAGTGARVTGEKYFVLVNNGTEAVFKNLANGGVIPVGKAYLDASSTLARGNLSILFDDGEATSINDVNRETTNNGCYNLNGQRVENPTKGLYIVNGKKVIIK